MAHRPSSYDAEPFPDTQESQLVPAAISPGLLKGKRCFSRGTALGCHRYPYPRRARRFGGKPSRDHSPGGMEKAAAGSGSAPASPAVTKAPGLGLLFLTLLPLKLKTSISHQGYLIKCEFSTTPQQRCLRITYSSAVRPRGRSQG